MPIGMGWQRGRPPPVTSPPRHGQHQECSKKICFWLSTYENVYRETVKTHVGKVNCPVTSPPQPGQLNSQTRQIQNFFWRDGRDFWWFTFLGDSHTNTNNTTGEIFVNYKDNISKSEVWNLFQKKYLFVINIWKCFQRSCWDKCWQSQLFNKQPHLFRWMANIKLVQACHLQLSFPASVVFLVS